MHISTDILHTLSYNSKLQRADKSAWIGHLPFASTLVREIQPKIIVELGTHWGESYFTFCQTIKENKLSAFCYAVDTWQGEQHAGTYDESVFTFVNKHNEQNYSHFSKLLRTTFDEAVHQFSDASIDLLHIDGLHTYEAVKNDFENWLPKVKEGGVILFHDIYCRHENFRVWKLWEEIKQCFPYTLELHHCHGLGVLINSHNDADALHPFLQKLTNPSQEKSWQQLFSATGTQIQNTSNLEFQIAAHQNQLNQRDTDIANLQNTLSERDESISNLKTDVKERDKSIDTLKSSLCERDIKINSLQTDLKERDINITDIQNTLSERDTDIANLQNTLSERDTDIANLQNTLSERDECTINLQSDLNKRNKELKEKKDKITRMQNSFSWKSTAPLRAIRRIFEKTTKQANAPATMVPVAHDTTTCTATTTAAEISFRTIERQRFPACIPLNYKYTPANTKRVSIVTDSVSKGSLFGGVATAIIYGALWAAKNNASLRIITRTEKAEIEAINGIINLNNIEFSGDIECILCEHTSDTLVEISEGEQLLSTSWWTTQCLLNSGLQKHITYLLQEDERMFYPLGDDYLMAEEVMKSNDIHFIINSPLLYQHLIADGFSNLQSKGSYFNPAFNEKYYFYDQSEKKDKLDFFFYARPMHQRNVYHHGMKVIEEALKQKVFDPEKWRFHFVGKHVPHVNMDPYEVLYHDDLAWKDYTKLMRTIDLGLSLMITPHTSYPPIDIAASGGVVVTNKWGNKKDLSESHSSNIITKDIDIASLLQGLEEGIQLASNNEQRIQNLKADNIQRDWTKSLEEIVTEF